jgi:hypothetical protein
MARHLIDTDVTVDVSRRIAAAAMYVDSLDDITISIITAHAELGGEIPGLAYDLLKRHAKSDGLRTFDALIAATAIEEGLTLVSKNQKHFQMISQLNLEVPNNGRGACLGRALSGSDPSAGNAGRWRLADSGDHWRRRFAGRSGAIGKEIAARGGINRSLARPERLELPTYWFEAMYKPVINDLHRVGRNDAPHTINHLNE